MWITKLKTLYCLKPLKKYTCKSSQKGRPNIILKSILFKLIYRFKVISIKIPANFCRYSKIILKFI